MNKRTFIKTSSAIVAGAVLTRLAGCTPKQEHLKNWAGNLEYSTGNVHYPKTVEQVQDVVKKCKQLRALGSRHSFNKIADSTENQVSTKALNKIISLDKSANTVTVEAGIKYGELCKYLDEMDTHFTTWLRCHIFLLADRVPRQHMGPECRMEISQLLFLLWNS